MRQLGQIFCTPLVAKEACACHGKKAHVLIQVAANGLHPVFLVGIGLFAFHSLAFLSVLQVQAGL